MEMKVLAVYDVASGVFARPIFVASNGAGLRLFADEVNRAALDNVMHAHPADFQLFELGTFSDLSGYLDSLAQPVRLATGAEVFIAVVK